MPQQAPASASLLVQCPYCQTLMANDGSLSGQGGMCPNCRNELRMPGGDELPLAKPVDPARLAELLPAVIRSPLPLAANQAKIATIAQGSRGPQNRQAWFQEDGTLGGRLAENAAGRIAPSRRPTKSEESHVPPVSVVDPALPSAPRSNPPLGSSTPNDAASIAPIASAVRLSGSSMVEPPLLESPFMAPAADKPPCATELPIIEDIAVRDTPEPMSFEEFAGLRAELAPRAVETAVVVTDQADQEPPPDKVPLAVWNSLQRNLPAWLTSMAVHAALLLALAMLILAHDWKQPLELEASWSAGPSVELETQPVEIAAEAPETVDLQAETDPDSQPTPQPTNTALEIVSVPESMQEALGSAEPLPQSANAVQGLRDATQGLAEGSFEGRQPALRQKLLQQFGGTVSSETAVARGLKWLKEHQNADGSWSFDHSACPACKGRCRNAGTHQSATGATAMALLPFLGAGQTHKQGSYQTVIRKGLYYLTNAMRGEGETAGDLRGETGDMYCHGLAAITLCEAYAVTRDKGLLEGPAQKSLAFISYAQDEQGGGWRYRPGQTGDTSVVGWQIMALKSGHLAGVQLLDQRAPSGGDMYYNYYATQVMHHNGGDPWKRWNKVMRDQLVTIQSRSGHENGSWAGHDYHGVEGGRLYETSLSIMTLEVYYRHLPLYREDSALQQFKGQ